MFSWFMILMLVVCDAIILTAPNTYAEKDVIEGKSTMKVGFSRIDITPPLGTHLSGQLVSLPAREVESNLNATAMYLVRLLHETGVRLSRLASGLPVGGDLEYADRLTLARSLKGRISLSS